MWTQSDAAFCSFVDVLQINTRPHDTLRQVSVNLEQERSAERVRSGSQRSARVHLPAKPQTWRIAFKSQHD